jgi:hypothetical protein
MYLTSPPASPPVAAGATAEAFTAAYAQEHTRLPHIIDLLSPGAHKMLGLPARDAVEKVAAVAAHAADHGGWVTHMGSSWVDGGCCCISIPDAESTLHRSSCLLYALSAGIYREYAGVKNKRLSICS